MVMLKALWSKRAKPTARAVDSQLLSVDEFQVHWRKSARRSRSLALKVDKTGQLIVMTPLSTPVHQVRRFIKAKQVWIVEQITRHEMHEAQKERARGASLQLLGMRLDIKAVLGPRNRSEQQGNTLCLVSRRVDPGRDYLETRANAWLREQANDVLPQRLQALSLQTDLNDSGLQIKSYRARWGSCRHNGIIQLNWKLVMAPPEVIDYVIVHELSHLEHFNHSAAFWSLVKLHCPDFKDHRQWLKQHGRLLITRD